jgi:hypothetical protein
MGLLVDLAVARRPRRPMRRTDARWNKLDPRPWAATRGTEWLKHERLRNRQDAIPLGGGAQTNLLIVPIGRGSRGGSCPYLVPVTYMDKAKPLLSASGTALRSRVKDVGVAALSQQPMEHGPFEAEIHLPPRPRINSAEQAEGHCAFGTARIGRPIVPNPEVAAVIAGSGHVAMGLEVGHPPAQRKRVRPEATITNGSNEITHRWSLLFTGADVPLRP